MKEMLEIARLSLAAYHYALLALVKFERVAMEVKHSQDEGV